MISKALLIGVSNYLGHAPNLDLCSNDILCVEKALVDGLNVKNEDIVLCGRERIVKANDVFGKIQQTLYQLTEEDTFIFYFSGHGTNTGLVVSDRLITYKELIDEIEKSQVKKKIVILDTCHSGSLTLDNIPNANDSSNLKDFIDKGYAIMASCSSEGKSGFSNIGSCSKYTYLLCNALTLRSIIRKGKKSLEDINQAIFHLANVSHCDQQPIFRTSLGGTIYFEVEEYSPYKINRVYEEHKEYIIYSVKPLHQGGAKRLSAKIILRFPCTADQVAKIALEINSIISTYEIHQNEKSEMRYHSRKANMIFCLFGYDETDILNANFAFKTTWVDENQDKDNWYKHSDRSTIIEGVCVESLSMYQLIKDQQNIDKTDIGTFVQDTQKCTQNLLNAAKQFCFYFHEYLNDVISEEQLIKYLEPINKEIEKWYLIESDLPIAPNELHSWSNAHSKIAGSIYDFSLYYNSKHLHTWNTNSRKVLARQTIQRYVMELEELKQIDDMHREILDKFK